MKLIIAGCRDFYVTNEQIQSYINQFKLQPSVIISGGARGIDSCGDSYAQHRGLSLHHYPANWNEEGKAAGPIRNNRMAKDGDALLLIWDGKSIGSANMKRAMQKAGKPIYEILIQTGV